MKREELIKSIEYIFSIAKRDHGNSEAIDWVKVAIAKTVDHIILASHPKPQPQQQEKRKTLTTEEKQKLAEIYKTNRVCVAEICDEVLDRSGGLLGEIREIYNKNENNTKS